ncbi:polyprenyl synthetase family protein [Portibacter marinus]|uniref:polyprenyl synthetase family protein n=1 Tax=Portibacter marinus TaxID=2898660 RepID=UPI001F23F998|nr:polyprenyl synthetase family protein [Portibacter marinus]
MPLSLKEIKKPVQADLEAFQKHFRQSMKSNVRLLDTITYYIVQGKGKQIRPLFVFLCAKLFGEINDSSHDAASFIEILHTATLVHDDVVDDSSKRRGLFSINALWKNKVAVLVGDFLYAKGFLLALENEQFKLIKIVSTAIKEIIEGEVLQLDKARRLDIDEEVYFEIIRQKTASLIAAACAAGASTTSDDPEVVEKMRLFGENIGIAFQIKDDLFDYGEDDIGKPTGIDIKEKKMTLPLIHVLKNSDRSTKRWIINTVKRHNNNKKKVRALVEFVKEKGGLTYAQEALDRYHKMAIDILHTLQPSPARDSIENLVHFVISRTK